MAAAEVTSLPWLLKWTLLDFSYKLSHRPLIVLTQEVDWRLDVLGEFVLDRGREGVADTVVVTACRWLHTPLLSIVRLLVVTHEVVSG
jgi:hypothetical protein